MNCVLCLVVSGTQSCPHGWSSYSLSSPLGLLTALTYFHSKDASGGRLIGLGNLVGVQSPMNQINSSLFSNGTAAKEWYTCAEWMHVEYPN